MTVHPDRYSTTGVSSRKAGVVIHDSEGPDGSYDVLVRLLSLPGDRPIAGSNPPHKYGSSYHALTKNNAAAEYDQVLDADKGPFAAPPLNKTWWHICIPGYARQTRDEWLNDSSRQGILAVAEFIVDKAKVDGFPLERVNASDLKAGKGGYCAHADVSQAWDQTNHTDPGNGFPWDVLAADIAALVTVTPPPIPPPALEDNNMHVIVGRKDAPSDPKRWAWDGISMRWIASEDEFVALYESQYALFKLHPNFNSLANPYWMHDSDITRYCNPSRGVV